MNDQYDTFVVFCALTTRMYTEMDAALKGAFYESSINGFKPVDIYGCNAEGACTTHTVATVTAGRAA